MAILDYIMSFFLERKKDDNVNWIVTIKSALLNKKKTGQMREKEWKKGEMKTKEDLHSVSATIQLVFSSLTITRKRSDNLFSKREKIIIFSVGATTTLLD